jgi:hypothetical protein
MGIELPVLLMIRQRCAKTPHGADSRASGCTASGSAMRVFTITTVGLALLIPAVLDCRNDKPIQGE